MEEGHINDTFKIITKGSTYVLQRKNAAVFTNMAALLFNLQEFIASTSDSIYSNLFFQSKDGNLFFKDETTDHWVLMKYVEGRKANLNAAQDLQLLGQSVGTFITASTPLKPNELQETLPYFHDINFRLGQFDEAKRKCKRKLSIDASYLFEQIRSERKKLVKYKSHLDTNCKIRVCHNDTKYDNIIIKNESAILLDLDTIMRGYIAYDFGDTLRSISAKGQEDKIELRSKHEIENIHKQFRKGFLSTCKTSITNSEITSLDYATQYMCYLMGIRFLTDYLNGDIYYKVNYDSQNLLRAEGQLKLANHLKNLYF